MSVVRSDVIRSLESMGLKAGDRVMVHSSLSSMGHVEGGAPTVLQAFLDVLGAAGTLMVPTFTHSGCQYYDPLLTPSLNGAITEAARSLPGAIRSLHPTHAVTVVGPDAEDLVEDDLDRGALGRDSALDRLIKKGGHVFLLGVDHRANSSIHIGEDYAGDDRQASISPDHPKVVVLNHPQRGEEEVTLTEMMGSTIAFDRMEEVLRSRDQVVKGKIGEATCQLMKGKDIIAATVDILRGPHSAPTA
ncbi:MAG: AAC(3) family N-acetyltransferase [Candidatus Latescibacterota bacterium]|nr:AAC(3) family N-acetyltransferase [Candidatus Latescibacterota bacterium]MEE3042469.1 AAC(3) family N-acetyltransferase [Candidatus Latescibacterota bacterium]